MHYQTDAILTEATAIAGTNPTVADMLRELCKERDEKAKALAEVDGFFRQRMEEEEDAGRDAAYDRYGRPETTEHAVVRMLDEMDANRNLIQDPCELERHAVRIAILDELDEAGSRHGWSRNIDAAIGSYLDDKAVRVKLGHAAPAKSMRIALDVAWCNRELESTSKLTGR